MKRANSHSTGSNFPNRRVLRVKSSAALMTETLESRVFLSGTVLASVTDGNLHIRGDAENNTIVVDQIGLSAGQVRITGTAATSINGQADPVILDGITQNVLIRMAGGADSVAINDSSLPVNVSVNAETVTFQSTEIERNTRIVSKKSGARFIIDDSTFHGAVGMHTGKGDDTILIESQGDPVGSPSLFEGRVMILLSRGDDLLQVGVTGQNGNQSIMSGKAHFGGSAGFDTLRSFDASTYTGNGRFRIRNFEANTSAPETTAPAVSSTDPANLATDIARNRKLSATFSEAMDAATIIGANVNVTAPGAVAVAGVVSYVGTTMTFTPTDALAADTIYTGTITTGAKDVAGNALANDYVWSFTTGSTLDTVAPLVSSTDPGNAGAGVALNKKLAATFSEAMDPTTITATSFTVTGPGLATVSGAVTYVGNTATFTPAASLDANTTYTATITTGAADLAGNTLASDYAWTFTTGTTADTTAPAVSSSDPASAATDVALNKKVLAVFSEAMDPATITAANVRLTGPASAVVSGTVGYVGTTMTFTPSSLLAPNTVYTVRITTAAKDLAGNSLAANFVSSFTTGATPDVTAPTVSTTNPADQQTNVLINKTVAGTFSESMDPLTVVASNFHVTGPNTTPVAGTLNYDAATKTATFTPSNNLAINTVFTATIDGGTNGVKDLAGNPLANDKVWTFTSGTQIAQARINLGRAATYAVMATDAISGTGTIQINGDVGINPGSAQGIPPSQINGSIHVTDQSIIDAQSDLLAGYNDAVSRSVTSVSLPGNMGGLTFTPGLYTNSSSVLISGAGPSNNVTLDAQGDENAIFIFKMGSTLTTGPGSQVILAGGAKAANVFWQVGTSATLDTTTTFKGNILASVTITVNNGSAVEGRLLGGSNSSGSVTVNGSTVTVPV